MGLKHPETEQQYKKHLLAFESEHVHGWMIAASARSDSRDWFAKVHMSPSIYIYFNKKN